MPKLLPGCSLKICQHFSERRWPERFRSRPGSGNGFFCFPLFQPPGVGGCEPFRRFTEPAIISFALLAACFDDPRPMKSGRIPVIGFFSQLCGGVVPERIDPSLEGSERLLLGLMLEGQINQQHMLL